MLCRGGTQERRSILPDQLNGNLHACRNGLEMRAAIVRCSLTVRNDATTPRSGEERLENADETDGFSVAAAFPGDSYVSTQVEHSDGRYDSRTARRFLACIGSARRVKTITILCEFSELL